MNSRSDTRGGPGLISVIVVNFRGAEDTITCLNQLAELDYPAELMEVICVDNASGDGSLERIRAAVPDSIVLVDSPTNGGFTGGCNLGAARARGEYLAFINNDARPDRGWLREAMGALESDSSIACVASKVLDWDGEIVDYVDSAVTWYGMGYKPGAGSPYGGTHESPKDVLFPTGSAMVVRAADFRELDGFDERYFMFYEDVDFGWRLNLRGRRVRYVPTSVVYHKHHASMKSYGAYTEWFLLERNALMTMYKNLSSEALQRLFAPALALSIRRSLAVGDADTGIVDLSRGLNGDDSDTATVSKRSLVGPYAVDSFVEKLDSLSRSREQIQRDRVVSDLAIRHLFGNAIEPAIPNDRYLAGHQALVDAFEVAEWFSTGARILVVTSDPLAARMAGPAIRAFHIAKTLAESNDVRLVSTASCSLQDPGFPCAARSLGQLTAEVTRADVVIFQGFLLSQAPWLARTDKILIADLYDPMHLEQLEQTRGDATPKRAKDIATTTEALNLQLLRGDFFLCASERQRMFWLGQLAGVGRLNPSTYDPDQSLQNLIAVAPFGLPDEPPVRTSSPIKGGRLAGVAPTDKVILWAGGIYNWFDPLTLINAVGELSRRRPDVRLVFLGTQHPNPLVPEMRMVAAARALADTRGLLDRFVFFNDGWVPYDQRQNFLLDADLGVSNHFEHIETTFAFRTRILDYLWAGLPMVVTRGDTFADLIAERGLGLTVPERDVHALADALEQALYDAEFAAACRANVAQTAAEFTWSVTLRPLVEFCRAPVRAPDSHLTEPPSARAGAALGGRLRSDLALAREYAKQGGSAEVARRIAGRLRRTMSGPGRQA
jgi:GT2 family glycosyltransferase